MLGMNSALTRPALGNCITAPFKPATGSQARDKHLNHRLERAASTWLSDLYPVAGFAIIVGYIVWNLVS